MRPEPKKTGSFFASMEFTHWASKISVSANWAAIF